MEILDLIIEITRRCNIACDHCLRGETQNIDMDISLIDKLFDQIESISTITFSGGEPSLVPHIISAIISLAKEKQIPISNFYIATNAVKITDEFIIALLNAWLYCDDNEISSVDISSDIQHITPSIEDEKLMAFKFVKKRDENHDFSIQGAIAEGRALYYPHATRIDPKPIEIYDNQIETLYLNCLGNLLSECDLSYESQNNKDIIIGNVMRKNFSLSNSIKRYNNKLNISLNQRSG